MTPNVRRYDNQNKGLTSDTPHNNALPMCYTPQDYYIAFNILVVKQKLGKQADLEPC